MTDVDRAIASVKELMDAHLHAIRIEIRGLRDGLARYEDLPAELEDLRIRTTALEAMDRSREKRLAEARAYRRIHIPTFVLAGLGALAGLASAANAVFS